MAAIEYPITVESVEFEKADTISPPLFRGEVGDFVAVRPCGEEYENKTYLGVMIGDVALTQMISFNKESGKLTVSKAMHNPGISVPQLGKIIYGCESWWGLISTPDDMKQITDQDIDNVWYVQALKALEDKAA